MKSRNRTLVSLLCIAVFSVLGVGSVDLDEIMGKDDDASVETIPPPPPPPTAVVAKTGLPPPSGVFCLSAEKSKSKAEKVAEKYRKKGLKDAGILWIPDYASLSEAEMYLVHGGTHPFADVAGAKARLKKIQRYRKKAYALKLDTSGPRIDLKRY